jgi:hypothetical protein
MSLAISWFVSENGSIIHILTRTFTDLSSLPQFEAISPVIALLRKIGTHLKKHSGMFGNPVLPFNVPTYSMHVDCSAHDTAIVKAHCNALMFEASLQASESVTDQLYP